MHKGVDPALTILRERAKNNELTYSFIMDCLKAYKAPRNKLSKLLKSKALIRVKKGFYVFNSPLRQGPVCKEYLSNIMFGPSYVSLEWALSFYGMIPEGVEEVTSVTSKKNKNFETPIGRFSYTHCHVNYYSQGIVLQDISSYQKYLIASKEKALCDLLVLRRGMIKSIKELKEMLYEDFRIDEDELLNLNLFSLRNIYQAYPHSAVEKLISFLEQLKELD
jgi:predicted transcriptional regulator of viral defense system